MRSERIHRLFGEPIDDSAVLYKHIYADPTSHSRWSHLLVIHPMSRARNMWDSLIMLLTIYIVIVLPVRLAFFWDDTSQINGWIIADIIIDCTFLFDILLNFNTGAVDETNRIIIMDRRRFIPHYLKNWFAIDFVSAIPLDIILLGVQGGQKGLNKLPKLIRILRFSKLVRLLRVNQFARYLAKFHFFAGLTSFVSRIIKLFFAVLLFAHWDACIQFLCAAVNDFPENSWVVQAGLDDEDAFSQYTVALFQAFSNMLSIGYGPYPPGPLYEYWVIVVSMCLGTMIYVVLVGIITSVLVSADHVDSMYFTQLSILNEYMAMRSLPLSLRARIRENYQFRWQTGKFMPDREILAMLPSSIRTEVAFHNAAELMANTPFFKSASPGFLASLVVRLEAETFLPGDAIFQAGEIANDMHFISSGKVSIQKDGEQLTVLGKGAYFGEVGILRNSLRAVDAIAMSPVECFSLSRSDFREILEQYPGTDAELRKGTASASRAISLSKSSLRQRQQSGTEASSEVAQEGETSTRSRGEESTTQPPPSPQ